MRLASAALLSLVAAGLLLAACGGDDELEAPPTVTVIQDTAPAPTPDLQTQPPAPQTLDPDAVPAEDGIISIEARNTLFTPNLWTMSVGETVTIRVENADEKQHNLRIAGIDGTFDTDDDALAVPDPIGVGESGELIFAPLVPGEYTFRCDFHPDQMGGQIEVEPGIP